MQFQGLTFIGRKVKIDFKGSVSSGKNLILNEMYINGLSEKGFILEKIVQLVGMLYYNLLEL